MNRIDLKLEHDLVMHLRRNTLTRKDLKLEKKDLELEQDLLILFEETH